jgi:hypothetical protein
MFPPRVKQARTLRRATNRGLAPDV